LCDEQAFWRTDEGTANPDIEILNALKPSMATVPGARLLKASSPYARRGVLWNDYRRHYGRDDSRTLVWQADTRSMNPSVPQAFIDEQYEDDPASASAEYGAEFRDDISGWLPQEIIESAVDLGVTVRPMQRGYDYFGFVDPSGGARDSFTCGIAHVEDNVSVLDALIEIPAPFNPEAATKQIAGLLSAYGLREATGDRYAAAWVVDAFDRCGVHYKHSDRDRSALYRDLLPKFNSGTVRLLDNSKLVSQFAGLERTTSSLGRDKIDHGPGGHDDLANAAAGALVNAEQSERLKLVVDYSFFNSGPPKPIEDADENFQEWTWAFERGELKGHDLRGFLAERAKRARRGLQ
jgi:hypothetical protein